MRDLDAYLTRIGLRGTPSVSQLHLAHCTSIPFEALDPQMGRPVSLGDDELEHKLVTRRRGGYCFEQNLLLASALRALGHEPELYLARVLLRRSRDDSGTPRPRSHLVLRVGELHADVGLGGGPLLEPLPWGPGGEHEQAGWRYRILERGPEWIVQTVEQEEWVDVYGFLPFPVPRIEVETINWWTSTNPESSFVRGLLVSRHWADGRRLVLSDFGALSLVERTPGFTDVSQLRRSELPQLLAERFELPGFVLRADGHLESIEQ
jgi:N-hydroxyarylamine O-acetyltransferase